MNDAQTARLRTIESEHGVTARTERRGQVMIETRDGSRAEIHEDGTVTWGPTTSEGAA